MLCIIIRPEGGDVSYTLLAHIALDYHFLFRDLSRLGDLQNRGVWSRIAGVVVLSLDNMRDTSDSKRLRQRSRRCIDFWGIRIGATRQLGEDKQPNGSSENHP